MNREAVMRLIHGATRRGVAGVVLTHAAAAGRPCGVSARWTAVVYELTERGRALQRTVDALEAWGNANVGR